MNYSIYNSILVFHIVGITIMAGSTFVDYITFIQLWKAYSGDKPRALFFEDMARRLQRFMSYGMALIILSGIGMMTYLHKVWGQQLWFQIKMGVLILIIVNGLALRRTLGKQVSKLMTVDPAVDLRNRLHFVKRNLTIVQYIQMFLFVLVFTLSVYKFN